MITRAFIFRIDDDQLVVDGASVNKEDGESRQMWRTRALEDLVKISRLFSVVVFIAETRGDSMNANIEKLNEIYCHYSSKKLR